MSLRIPVRFISGILAIAFLSACVSAPQTLQLEKSPPDTIRHKVTLDHTPFFPQRDYQCGPAALATMLAFRDIDVVADDLTERVYIPQRKGSLQLEMVATARSYGALAYRLAPRLSAIVQEIDAGNPVLVFQDLSLLLWPQWHYAVAIGYDLDASELILRSGTQSRRTTRFSAFERSWKKAGHWAYVVMPPGDIPVTSNALDYVRASHDLQQSGQVDQALRALRQGQIKWPVESIILMALGNAEYSAGNHGEAIAAYQSEIELHPQNAAAWNNLSYALVAANCKTEAIKAISCANLIWSDDENLQHSRQEIGQMPDNGKGGCQPVHCPSR